MQDSSGGSVVLSIKFTRAHFRITNGHGIGDLPGIIRRLDHVVTLGIDAIRIPPIILPPWRMLDLTSQIIAMWRGSSGTSRVWTDWSPRRIGEGSDSFRISFPTTLPTSIPGLLKVEAYAPIRKETGTDGERCRWRRGGGRSRG